MEPGQDMGTSSNPKSHIDDSTGRSRKTDQEEYSGSESGEDNIPISSMPSHDSEGSTLSVLGSGTGVSASSEKESSKTQELAENGSSDPAISNRIPSSVFACNANPMDWSTASNESLFSIYMGNTSFSGDDGIFADISGETDLISEIEPGSASMNFSSSQRNEEGKYEDDNFQMNEARAAETMKEVLMENAQKSDGAHKVSTAEALPFESSRPSDFGSVSSNRSFAFQTVTGNTDKHMSSAASYKGQGKQAHSQSKPETEQDSPQSGPQTPQAQCNESQKGWFSCFPCCSSRC